MPRLENGDIVVHYKFFKNTDEEIENRKYIYRIINTEAWTSEDEPRRYVIYQALYGDTNVWLRPYDEFMSEINEESCPAKYRFSRVYRYSFNRDPMIAIDADNDLPYPKLSKANLECLSNYFK